MENEKKSRLRSWAVLSGIGFQMGATIFVCAWIGKKLDERFPSNKNWFTIGLVLFGVFASLYIVLKQLKNINK
ncbi:MAG: AtpZ/AtpI family protein [Flavobacteriaceae bacterium]|nr:AtpZ/AtpI family protein [Flavobacteriaceae bacterium]